MLVGRVWHVDPNNDNLLPPYTLPTFSWHRSNLDHVRVEKKQGIEGCYTAENKLLPYAPSLCGCIEDPA